MPSFFFTSIIMLSPHPTLPHEVSFSPSSLSFQALLHLDPKRRMPASEALKHPCLARVRAGVVVGQGAAIGERRAGAAVGPFNPSQEGPMEL